MKKTLYLMRHGQTLFNVRHKIQGWCDSPLTELGIRQAEAAAEFFDDIQLDAVYSSTAERCCDTVEIVTRNKYPYTRLKGLKEMNFGLFEGESEDLHPPKREDFAVRYAEFGGETQAQVAQRMKETCTAIMEAEGNNTVLAMSHAGANINFLSLWTEPMAALKKFGGFGNCSIFEYEYEDGVFTFKAIHHVEVKEEK